MRFALGFTRDSTPFTDPEPFEPTLACLRPLAETVSVVGGDAFRVVCEVDGEPAVQEGRLEPLSADSDAALMESLYRYARSGSVLLGIAERRIDRIPADAIAEAYFKELIRQSPLKPRAVGTHIPIRPEDIRFEPLERLTPHRDFPAEFRDMPDGTLLILPALPDDLMFRRTAERELRRRVAEAVNRELTRYTGKFPH